MTSTPEIVRGAMERRAAAGLMLRFAVPDRAEPFVCYPKDGAQKAKWLANAVRKGWEVLP